LIVVLDPFVVC